MSKVPTAEEFLKERCEYNSITGFYQLVEINDFIDFTKLHVEAQREAIIEKTELKYKSRQHKEQSTGICIDKLSILNAYPLDNIK